jgi:hypothetical protein
MGYIPKNAKWWIADLVLEFTVEKEGSTGPSREAMRATGSPVAGSFRAWRNDSFKAARTR